MPPATATRVRVVWRWAFVALVLLAEYLFTASRYDAYAVSGRGSGWQILAQAGRLAPFLVCAASAGLLFLWRRPTAFDVSLPKPDARLLALHVALFGAFLWITGIVFGGATAPDAARIWVTAWVLCALASPAALMFGMLGVAAPRRVITPGFIAFAVLVGSAEWLSGKLALELWTPLAQATLASVAWLLRLVFTEVDTEPSEALLALGDFIVTIAPACSGYEGIGLMAALVIGYLVSFRDRLKFPRALLLLPLSLVLAWCGNLLRIASLMVVGAYYDRN